MWEIQPSLVHHKCTDIKDQETQNQSADLVEAGNTMEFLVHGPLSVLFGAGKFLPLHVAAVRVCTTFFNVKRRVYTYSVVSGDRSFLGGFKCLLPRLGRI